MQVLTDPAIKRVLVGVHVVSGALYVVLFAGHLLASRPARNGARRGAGAGQVVPP